MKHSVRALLLFALCAAICLPCLPAAGADSPVYLPVTFVSSNGTPTNAAANADPAAVFADNAAYYAAKNAAEGVIIVGDLGDLYVITRITVRTPGVMSNRTRNSYLEGSADGTSWVTLAQQTTASDGNGDQEFVLTVADRNACRYVRIRQNDAYKNYDFYVTSVLFEGEKQADAPQWLPVAFLESNHRGDRDPSHSFLDDATDYHAIGAALSGGGCEPIYGVGRLAEPSKITKVVVRAPAASAGRMRSVKIMASTDGEAWDLLATGPSSVEANAVYSFPVDSDTLYRYIRYEQDAYCASQSWWFGIGSVLVEGVGISGLQDATFAAYQFSKTVTDTYSLRLICTLNGLDYDRVGVKISGSAQDGETRSYNARVHTVYRSVLGTVNGEPAEILASEFGATYLYTVVVENIPATKGLITFDVTPYVVKDGVETESICMQIVLNGAAPASASTYRLSENKSSLKISGRSSDVAEGIACDFTASGIEFNAILAGDLVLKVNCSATTYYTLYLNGERQPQRLTFSAGTAEYTIAEKLPAGSYNVKLVKQTHVAHSLSTLIDLKMCGNFAAAPAEKERYIEFIGDSITCGYGVVGYPTNGVTYYGTSEYCDATQAYAYKAAELLGADYSMVSVSGWAVLSGSNNCIPEIYGKTCWLRGDALYAPTRTPDVVVVNLGTNDKGMGTYETNFVSEAEAFLAQIRAMYPNVTIVWAYGAMMNGDALTNFESKLNTIMNDMGGESAGFYTVKVTYNQSAGNGHPSAAGHTAAAGDVANFITQKGLLN